MCGEFIFYGFVYLILGAVLILACFKEDWLDDIKRDSVRRIITVITVLVWPIVFIIDMLAMVGAVLWVIFSELFE